MTAQRIFGWAFVTVALLVVAEIPATQQLAIAFAYLILLSIVLTVGPVAFDNISGMVGGNVPVSGTRQKPV